MVTQNCIAHDYFNNTVEALVSGITPGVAKKVFVTASARLQEWPGSRMWPLEVYAYPPTTKYSK